VKQLGDFTFLILFSPLFCDQTFDPHHCNCRKQREGEEETIAPQNKFEILRSRVMQYGVEERIIRR